MKKIDIAINAVLAVAFVAFVLNMLEDEYLKFPDLRPIADTEIAKVLDGDKKDCLTIPSQTKPVPMSQALKLEGKTTRQVLSELGNNFCEGQKGAVSYLKFLTDSGKTLYVQVEKSLDEPIKYGFNAPTEADAAPAAQAGRTTPDRSVQVSRSPQAKGNPMEKR